MQPTSRKPAARGCGLKRLLTLTGRPAAVRGGVAAASRRSDGRRSGRRATKGHSYFSMLSGRRPTYDVPNVGPDQGRRQLIGMSTFHPLSPFSVPHHELARDRMGVASVIPATTGLPSGKAPAGPRRAAMRDRFAAGGGDDTYGQRWQVDTVNGMVKRNLGSACRATTARRRSSELLLRCITHHIMSLSCRKRSLETEHQRQAFSATRGRRQHWLVIPLRNALPPVQPTAHYAD